MVFITAGDHPSAAGPKQLRLVLVAGKADVDSWQVARIRRRDLTERVTMPLGHDCPTRVCDDLDPASVVTQGSTPIYALAGVLILHVIRARKPSLMATIFVP